MLLLYVQQVSVSSDLEFYELHVSFELAVSFELLWCILASEPVTLLSDVDSADIESRDTTIESAER